MNYFIDFDHTLYNTPELTKDMLNALSKYITNFTSQSYDVILSNLSEKFKRGKDNIYDIYDLISYFYDMYNYDKNEATSIINNVIYNGSKYVFSDSIPFLKYLKSNGHKIYILSYNENEVYFQTVKIAGSGLLKYVDGMTTTITLKGDMPINFSQCVFIDDKPKDLISIYKNNPLKVYRIRRPNDTYSNINIDDIPIMEFSSLSDLKLQIDKK